MKKKFHVGDKVLYDSFNGKADFDGDKLRTEPGIIIQDNNDDTYHVMYFSSYGGDVSFNINSECILPIEENEKERLRIIEIYDNLIEQEKKKLKTVSEEEKDKERLKRFNTIKHSIIRNCERCIDSDIDDDEFIHRIKEIAILKNQLLSSERLPCVNEVRSHNQYIKYHIKKLECGKNDLLELTSNENIEYVFRNFKKIQ